MSEITNNLLEQLEIQVEQYDEKRRRKSRISWGVGCLLLIPMLILYIYLGFFNTEFEVVENTWDDGCEYGIRIAHSTAYVVKIPAEYEGHVITYIDSENASNDNLKALIIEDGIQRIGKGSAESAERAYVSYLVMDGAFAKSPLWYVKIPSTLKYIESYAFYKCTNLRWIDFPESFEKCVIGGWSFAFTSISSLELPDGVEGIAEYGFAGCTRLKEVFLPDTVTQVGDIAFTLCEKLREVYLSSNMSYLSYGLFDGCKRLKHMEIPESIRYIERMALYDTKITSEMIPENIFYDGDQWVENGLDIEKENQYLMEVAGVPEEPLLSSHESNKVWIEGKYYEFPMTWEEFYATDEWEEKEIPKDEEEPVYMRVFQKDNGKSILLSCDDNLIVGMKATTYDDSCQVILPGGTVLGYSLPYRIHMQAEEPEMYLDPGCYSYSHNRRCYHVGQDGKYLVLLGDWSFDGTINSMEVCVRNLK